ncbi:MAG: hypothetical protein QGI34_11420 [Candidatus Latescibacteria bacterium]|jgi:hypothetical protein|nr:hypothetical protein [Candidatus Latescibacterota bacterium]
MLRAENEKNEEADDEIPCILEPELTDKAFRRNRARLIQKIYEIDPLLCPKCFGPIPSVDGYLIDPDGPAKACF